MPEHACKTPTKLKMLFSSSKPDLRFWFMRQAGRYLSEYREVRQNSKDFLNMCYTPAIASEVTMQPIRRFDMDAAIIFSDILVIPDALGVKVRFEKGEGPKLSPVRDESSINALTSSALTTFLEPVYEALRLTRKVLPESTSLIGFAGAPWTLACYMVEGQGSKEFPETRSLAYQNPDLFHQLIGLLTQAVSTHLIAQVEAGADVLQLFDSWAGILPEHQRQRWVNEPAKQIIRTVKAHSPDIPIIGFPKGIGTGYADYAKNTGVDGISLDTTVSLEWAVQNLPEFVVLQGNLDPLLLANSRPETLLEAAQYICNIMQKRRFIFNLGHGIIPQTPPENMAILCNYLKDQASTW